MSINTYIYLIQIHGGVTEEEISRFVSHVQKVAAGNQKMGLDTVLFFDEANTSDAIELIKEIMCDRRLNGETIQEGVKFIAACNPYKRYSDCIHFNHTIGNYYTFTVGSLCMRHKAL